MAKKADEKRKKRNKKNFPTPSAFVFLFRVRNPPGYIHDFKIFYHMYTYTPAATKCAYSAVYVIEIYLSASRIELLASSKYYFNVTSACRP